MHILGGKFKGHVIQRPKSFKVRPISGLTCSSLFNILGPLNGITFLDAYAGSGAIGLEALSRGADRVEAVEMLPEAIKVIKNNVQTLGVTNQYKLHAMLIEKWLKIQIKPVFDVIVAGPPFALVNDHIIEQLGTLLLPEGVLVLWHSSRITPPTLKSVSLVDSRTYGDSALSFYKN